MAFEYSIDTDRRVALLTFSGSVAGAELARATKTLYIDKAWQQSFDAVWDFTQITELLLEWVDFQALMDIDKEYADVVGAGRDVVVLVRKLDKAMGRIYSHLSKDGPRQSHVCRSLSEAWAIVAQGDDGAGE